MPEPINLRVPKSMPAEHVIWALRYGVVWARYAVLRDPSSVRRHRLAYVQAPASVLRLGERVRREAIRRMKARAERGIRRDNR